MSAHVPLTRIGHTASVFCLPGWHSHQFWSVPWEERPACLVSPGTTPSGPLALRVLGGPSMDVVHGGASLSADPNHVNCCPAQR